MTLPAGLRERKKDATRRALATKAAEYTLVAGYDAFTIGELASAVGVSRRTFSNYFPGKAACVVAAADDWIDSILGAIHRAPSEMRPNEVMRAALLELSRQMDGNGAALADLMRTHPELHAQVLAQDSAWASRVAESISQRYSLSATNIGVELLAIFGVTAARKCLDTWNESGRLGGIEGLVAMLDAAVSLVDVDGLVRSLVSEAKGRAMVWRDPLPETNHSMP